MAHEMFVWEEEIEELRDETTRLHAEVEQLRAFVAAFDRWSATREPGRFGSHIDMEAWYRMHKARAALPAAADPATKGVSVD